MQKLTAAQAQRKIDAIDKRIDAVRAELRRVAGIRDDDFDVMTVDGSMAMCAAYHVAWRDHPALRGFEASLLSRRYDAQRVHDKIAVLDARAEDRRKAKEMAAEWDAKNRCACCGQIKLAA